MTGRVLVGGPGMGMMIFEWQMGNSGLAQNTHHSILGGLGMFWLNKSPNYRATVNSGSINRYK
jgi:hypothetical protein